MKPNKTSFDTAKVKHPKVHPVKHPSIHPLSPSLADAISSGCSIDFTEASQTRTSGVLNDPSTF